MIWEIFSCTSISSKRRTLKKQLSKSIIFSLGFLCFSSFALAQTLDKFDRLAHKRDNFPSGLAFMALERANLVGDPAAGRLAEPFMKYDREAGTLVIHWKIDPNKVQQLQDEIQTEWKLKDDQGNDTYITIVPTSMVKKEDGSDEAPEYFMALEVYTAHDGATMSRAEWSVFATIGEPSEDNPPHWIMFDWYSNLALIYNPFYNYERAHSIYFEQEGPNMVAAIDTNYFWAEEPEPRFFFNAWFPKPDENNEEVEITQQWALLNDVVHDRNGLANNVFYNGTLIGRKPLVIKKEDLHITQNTSPWRDYVLDPDEPYRALFINEHSDFVVRGLYNVADVDLEDPNHLANVIDFKYNVLNGPMLVSAWDAIGFGDVGEIHYGMTVGAQDTPAYIINYTITDIEGLTSLIDLPEGTELATIATTDGNDEAYILSLKVYPYSGSSLLANSVASGALRAEWFVYVTDTKRTNDHDYSFAKEGPNPPPSPGPYLMSINLTGSVDTLDQDRLEVVKALPFTYSIDANNKATTNIVTSNINFEASFTLPDASSSNTMMDMQWVSANDRVYSLNGVYDLRLYTGDFIKAKYTSVDLTTLDVQHNNTPWSEFIDQTPTEILVLKKDYDFAVVPWANLEELDSLPYRLSDNEIVSGETKSGYMRPYFPEKYKFDADAGDTIHITSGGVTNFVTTEVVLIDKDNELIDVDILNGFGGTVRDHQLDKDGPYGLELREKGRENDGLYNVSLAIIPAELTSDCTLTSDGGVISSGKTCGGYLDPADNDIYEFEAQAGQILHLVARGVDGFVNPKIYLYGPDGRLVNGIPYLTNSAFLVNKPSIALTQDGRYTIVIEEDGLLFEGNYRLSIALIDGNELPDVSDHNDGLLVSGQDVLATMTPGDIDVFQFNASEGDTLHLIARGINGFVQPIVYLYDQNGVLEKTINYATGGDAFITAARTYKLTNTGTYTAVVIERDSDNTGLYNFSVALIPDYSTGNYGNNTQWIWSGTVGGNIRYAGMNMYRTWGQAGSVINLFAEGTTIGWINPVIYIYDDTGAYKDVITPSWWTATANYTLPATGSYTFLILDHLNDTQGGTYNFRITR